MNAADLAPASPPTRQPPQAHALAPLWRAHRVAWMLGQFAARGSGHGLATALTLPAYLDTEAWGELCAMQVAVLRRCDELHQGWIDGLTAVATRFHQARRANTLSKAVEQEYDVVAQLGALISNQTAKWVNLLENVQVDYGYWTSQQLERAAASGAVLTAATPTR